jgi:iron complex outermembrane receptor protein
MRAASKSQQRLLVAAAVGSLFPLQRGIAYAADIRVEVTGTNIKRVEGEGALPVQVITREDIDRSGATSTQELLQLISANNSAGAVGPASVIGSTTFSVQTASLRGLGGGRTLVLLNGQRLANFAGEVPGTGAGVDLTAIPFSAIERVEVLKDGASAIYGSDAVAGVINFILRQDYRGAEATVFYGTPTRSGGGQTTQYKACAGFGDLGKDKYNVFISGSYQLQKEIYARNRDFAKSSLFPDEGVDVTSGNTFPANVTLQTGGAAHNPAFPNCAPSLISPFFGGDQCRYDPQIVAEITPRVEQSSVFGSGRYQINADWQAYLTAAYSRAETRFIIQPVPLSDQFAIPAVNPISAQYGGVSRFLLPASSPFYPHALAQQLGVDGQPLNVRYRSVETGNRDTTDTNDQGQIVAGLKGAWKNWDFDAAFVYNESKNREHLNGGFPLLSRVLPLLNSGLVNPFGTNSPDISAQMQATNYVGDTFNGKNRTIGGNAKTSGEIWKLPAGPLAMAAGIEGREEKFDQTPNPALLTGDVSGYGGDFGNVSKSRNIYAAFAEFNAPIVKGLEADAAVRYDHYSDFGSTTNPKFSLRWQPAKELLLRASWGKGFLAPSLFQLYQPTNQSVSVAGLEDPIRCPVTGDSNDCSTQFTTALGGAPLKPEKSEQATFGVIWEPTNDLSFGVDLFKVNLSSVISAGLAPDFILHHLDQYGSLVTRGPPTPDFPTLAGPITLIDQHNLNLGNYRISGADIDVRYTFPKLDWGQLKFSLNGTYYIKYDIQNPDGSYTGTVSAPGQSPATAGGTGITPRWKHYAALNWTYGPWSATLANSFQDSYTDINTNLNNEPREVGTLSIWDIQGTYTGFKSWTLTLGVRNLFDKNPPFSNQTNTFQIGYDPSYYDARARLVYGSVTYSFKGM